MAVARFASYKPAADTDHLLFTIERTALTSLIAVNTSGFTNISAWIVPAGEDLNEDAWIPYVDNVGLTNRNSFETFRIAVNVGDKIYVRSASGEVTFFVNGIYDVAGRANVTISEQEPESPQIGDVWIDDSQDPKTIVYWDGTEWIGVGIVGPEGPAGPAGATGPAGADGADGVDGEDGLAATIAVGTVTTGAPGSSATITNVGTSQAAIFDFSIPQGATGETGPAGETFPDQTGNNGKYLTTDGSDVSWATVDALPSQSGQDGKYLTTDGTTASWSTITQGGGDPTPQVFLLMGA